MRHLLSCHCFPDRRSVPRATCYPLSIWTKSNCNYPPFVFKPRYLPARGRFPYHRRAIPRATHYPLAIRTKCYSGYSIFMLNPGYLASGRCFPYHRGAIL